MDKEPSKDKEFAEKITRDIRERREKYEQEMKEQMCGEYLDMLKRTQADFANYRKRVDEERHGAGKYANEGLIMNILPVLDNFKLATKHLPKELAGNDWVKGVAAIEMQFEKILADEGISEIEARGGDFDPSLHEAVSFEEKGADGKILEVLSAGYKLGDKVIRPAKVVVSKGEKK